MKYKLMNSVNSEYTTVEQILTNRGLKKEDVKHFLNTTDEDMNMPEKLGFFKLRAAGLVLIQVIKANENCIIVIDGDCDGYTSAALLANYLYKLFPSWIINHLSFFMHEGKQHGLEDFDFEIIKQKDIKLVICPDSASNDLEYHKKLKDMNVSTIVLDHHMVEEESEDAIVINSQLNNYSNPSLSGVGVTYQFCRFLDEVLDKNYADEFLDLVALGLQGDMMSMLYLETKHLINKGLRQENIKNPFIYEMAKKNKYSLGEEITPMGASFYIVPFVNAMVRSGTMEEKELLFKSMLAYEAFKKIPSTKRGHKGEEETIAEQAIRTCTNVKSRQKRAEDEGLALLENIIEEKDMLQKHKVLLFTFDEKTIEKNIGGLAANRIANKYQRPCCILTKKDNFYQGSARGYSYGEIKDFNKVCRDTGIIDYAIGHNNAFGISLSIEKVNDFIKLTDDTLKNISSEPVYLVDYIFNGYLVNSDIILDIANMKSLWGQDLPEPYVVLKRLTITSDMITLMSPDVHPTLKITLPNKISLIKFNSSAEEYEKYCGNNCGDLIVDIVGQCAKNEWNGNITPQILIKDIEIIDQHTYSF